MRLPRWTRTCRTRFLELPTRKIPTVCSPKSKRRFSLSASTLVCFQYLWTVYKEHWRDIFCFSSTNMHGFFPRMTYRVVRGAGSRAPRRVEPVCKEGWGWAFSFGHVSSSCCRPFLQAQTGGAPLRAATGYRQGRWCNPQIRRPAGEQIDCDQHPRFAHWENIPPCRKRFKRAGNRMSVLSDFSFLWKPVSEHLPSCGFGGLHLLCWSEVIH